MLKIVDARGLACPEPVVLTKREFDMGAAEVTTIVDNDTARENLTRLGQSLGCQVAVNTENNEYYVTLSRTPGAQAGEAQALIRDDVLLVATEHFGRGEAELGAILMKSFFFALSETPGQIRTIIFMNAGVKLTTAGSPVLELLQSIAEQGVEIYSCGTCLDYFQLKEQVKVGAVTNMYSALETMQQAGKVLTV